MIRYISLTFFISIAWGQFEQTIEMLRRQQAEQKEEEKLMLEYHKAAIDRKRLEEEKHRNFINLLNSATSVDGSDERVQITDRWPNGLKKTVFVMKGTGLNETVTHHGFREDGKPQYIKKAGTDWVYQYFYDDNGNIEKEGATNGVADNKNITVGLWTFYHENGSKSAPKLFRVLAHPNRKSDSNSLQAVAQSH